MQSEVLSIKGGSFDSKIKAMTSLGALFVCTSSTLATHQFLLKYWKVLFFIGCAIVVTGTGTSVIRSMLKRYGYVSADLQEEKEKRKEKRRENLNPYSFKGKRLAG